ncbi:MAG: septum formation protein [Planctomycetota bacterium]|jgi:septum formation protein
MKKISDFQIVLASNSPRRKELLAFVVPNFIVKTKEVAEIYPETIQKDTVAEYLAKLKASVFEGEINENEIFITSDTIVLLGDSIFGKPKDKEDAIYILQQLSGKNHQVITGVCFKTATKEISFSHSTEVIFKELSLEEITYYIDTFKPYDKAGAYAIQEWIGFIGVEKINGDYNNIVGLPVQEMYSRLQQFVTTI